MEITFNPTLVPPWTLTDDKIISGGKVIELSSIARMKHTPPKMLSSNGVIQLFYANGGFETLAYPKSQKMYGEEAAQYIQSFMNGEITVASKAAHDSLSALGDLQKNGFRKKCNICGHIFCYTLEDLEENRRLAKSATGSSIVGIVGALGGYYAASSNSTQSANDQLARMVDYSKCPKCGSRNLVDATDEDIERNKAPQGTVIQQTSAADELKKFKELLDMGIITQEEFDAKKKQLLGL